MTTPTAIAMSNFSGVVTLDDAEQKAFFGFTIGPDQHATILMARDPSPGGVLSRADVVAMWQFYKTIGWVGGGARTVWGHTGYPPNGNVPLLFVVRG